MEPGIELCHFEEGSETSLLIVHGGLGFPPEKPWQDGNLLARHYRTIYYPQRVCGNSSRPISSFSTPTMYSNMKLLNEPLGLPVQITNIERIRQIIDQQKLIFVRHSFGAMLVALYVAEYSEHMRAAFSSLNIFDPDTAQGLGRALEELHLCFCRHSDGDLLPEIGVE
jgi:pimeloyl-ACP methyl ester carboxylesterase